MSQAASQYAAFWRDVKTSRTVWTVKDDRGFPAPKTSTGQRAMPFWSTRSRVERIIRAVPAYSSFTPHELSWDTFFNKWLPGLQRSRTLVGVNWSGTNAHGYDISASGIRKAGIAIMGSLKPAVQSVPKRSGGSR